MTRILHVLDHSLPLHSGYTFRTRAIMTAQMANGLDVRGITGLRQDAATGDAGGHAPSQTVEGLRFHRTPPASVGTVPLVREWREVTRLADAIVALAGTWRPDVLHAHSPALCGLAAVRAGARLGIPVVYEIRAFWEDAAVGNLTGRPGNWRYRLTRALENHVVSRAAGVVTICQGLRGDLVRRGHPAAKIAIVPNGVDLDLFGTPALRDPALAAELGLGDGPVIAFIGSFYDYEGLDVLVAAMPALLARHPDARLLLTGGGPMADAVRAQVAASAAAPAIRFTGRVPHADVARYYALADIMAYPRKASRLTELVTPLKPLEAMAQDRLVAASDVGGHRELIPAGTGVLFAPDDPAACAAALGGLIADRAAWDTIRAAGRAHVRAHHDWAGNVARYREIYQTVAAVPDADAEADAGAEPGA